MRKIRFNKCFIVVVVLLFFVVVFFVFFRNQYERRPFCTRVAGSVLAAEGEGGIENG